MQWVCLRIFLIHWWEGTTNYEEPEILILMSWHQFLTPIFNPVNVSKDYLDTLMRGKALTVQFMESMPKTKSTARRFLSLRYLCGVVRCEKWIFHSIGAKNKHREGIRFEKWESPRKEIEASPCSPWKFLRHWRPLQGHSKLPFVPTPVMLIDFAWNRNSEVWGASEKVCNLWKTKPERGKWGCTWKGSSIRRRAGGKRCWYKLERWVFG